MKYLLSVILMVLLFGLSSCSKEDNPVSGNSLNNEIVLCSIDTIYFNTNYTMKNINVDFKDNIDSLIISFYLTTDNNHYNNTLAIGFDSNNHIQYMGEGLHTDRRKNEWSGVNNIKLYTFIFNNGWIHINNFSIKGISK